MENYQDYAPVHVRTGVYKLKDGDKSKNLILIHGLHGDGAFNAEGDQMRDFYLALLHGEASGAGDAQPQSSLDGYTVWALSYNTMFMPFDISGSWLADELSRMTEYDFSGAIVVGYSMGGLIGRVLVAKGFNFKYLVTIDTPHEGPMEILNAVAWAAMFVPGCPNYVLHGMDSLIWGSGSQHLIHDSKLDQEKRKTSYAFYATGYYKEEGAPFESSDDVVPIHSQLSMSDGDVRWRAVWKKTYEKGAWERNNLHSKASRPVNCQEVLTLVRQLLKGEPLPERKLDETPATAAASTKTFGAAKPPIEVDGWTAWYWFDKNDCVQMRIALRVQNTDTKPLKLSLRSMMRVQGGDVRPLENVDEIMLPPKVSRKFVFAVDRPVNELLPDEVELVSYGESRKLTPMFVPFDLDPAVALPAESCWQLGLELGAVAVSVSEDGYFTEVTVPMTVDNPSPCAFYLDHSGLNIRLDVTDEPFYGFTAASDVRDDKRVRIAPTAKTTLSVTVQWPNAVGRPNKVVVSFGGSAMPAGQAEVAIGA